MHDAVHMKDDTKRAPRRVWLMAAGFGVPGGIEAHILHYAVELRRRGWSPEVVVFFDYPHPPHRFMTAVDVAGIPRRSLNRMARRRTLARFAVRLLPWMVVQLAHSRRPRPRLLWNWLAAQGQIAALHAYRQSSPPDVMHVFGRLPHLAWGALPAERTIFHQMMTGDIDGIWTPDEMAGFVGFAERCRAFLAPGDGVIANLRRHFGIQREILPVYTLCPDAVGPERAAAMIAARREGFGGAYKSSALIEVGRSLCWTGCHPVPQTERQADLERSREADGSGLCKSRYGNLLRFGVICRLTPQKGIAYLLEALVAFRDRYGDVQFAFAGEGELEDEIRAFTARQALAHVTLERVVDPVAFLSGIDVFVHPSIGDAMPMAIAEALMCGLPCVVSRVGGCPDLVREGAEGIVIEPGRTESIVEAMIRFAEMTGEERDAFGRRARARFEAVCLPRAVGDVVEGVYGMWEVGRET